MYLRKTTTSLNRGIDILYPFYQILPETHDKAQTLDILQVGAGVVSKLFSRRANGSEMVRRFDSLFRSLPLSEKHFASHEPFELYQVIGELGFDARMRVADINANVLAVVKNQVRQHQIALELLDVSQIPPAFLSAQYDVCVILNVLPHIRCATAKQQAISNMIKLTKENGYLVGVAAHYINLAPYDVRYQMIEIDQLVHQKKSR